MGDVNWGGKLKHSLVKVQRATSCLMIVSIPARQSRNKWFRWSGWTLGDWPVATISTMELSVTSIQCTSPAVLYEMIYISVRRFTLHEWCDKRLCAVSSFVFLFCCVRNRNREADIVWCGRVIIFFFRETRFKCSSACVRTRSPNYN